MKRLFAVLGLLCAALGLPLDAAAQGQGAKTYPAGGGGQALGAVLLCQASDGLVYVCGTASNPINIAGTFSATLGGFTPATAGTPITATTGGATGTLPAGAVVVATNAGTTNAAYCALGASSSTSWQYIAPNGGWFAYTTGGATQLTCVTATSTTTVNMVGGSGLPTGTGGGGGSGGGGGGSVTQGTIPWADNISQFGGVTVSLGQKTMAASVPVVLPSDQTVNTGLNTTPSLANGNGVVPTQGGAVLSATNGLYANLLQGNAALSGSNPIPENTAQVNGVTTLTGAGATGTGSQRETVAQDTTTIAGSAPGTAGTPSTNVVTVQGPTSGGTPILVTPSAPADPCFASAKLQGNFSSTTSGGSIVAASSGKRIYVCQVSLITSAAANVSFEEGTGSSVCTGGTTAGDWLNTGTTAANGGSFAANGGISSGSGNGTVFSTQTANQNLCVLFTTTNTPTVVASVSYVQQ